MIHVYWVCTQSGHIRSYIFGPVGLDEDLGESGDAASADHLCINAMHILRLFYYIFTSYNLVVKLGGWKIRGSNPTHKIAGQWRLKNAENPSLNQKPHIRQNRSPLPVNRGLHYRPGRR